MNMFSKMFTFLFVREQHIKLFVLGTGDYVKI